MSCIRRPRMCEGWFLESQYSHSMTLRCSFKSLVVLLPRWCHTSILYVFHAHSKCCVWFGSVPTLEWVFFFPAQPPTCLAPIFCCVAKQHQICHGCTVKQMVEISTTQFYHTIYIYNQNLNELYWLGMFIHTRNLL